MPHQPTLQPDPTSLSEAACLLADLSYTTLAPMHGEQVVLLDGNQQRLHCMHCLALRRHRQRVLPELRFDVDIWLAMHEDLKSVRRIRVLFDGLVEGLIVTANSVRNANGAKMSSVNVEHCQCIRGKRDKCGSFWLWRV